MTGSKQPDDTEADQWLDDMLDKLVNTAVMYDFPADKYRALPGSINTTKAAILKHEAAEKLRLLDRVEQSVKQHTVPESRDMVTRSYVLNTLEFERAALRKLSGDGGV